MSRAQVHKCKLPPVQAVQDGTKWVCYFGKCRLRWVMRGGRWARS